MPPTTKSNDPERCRKCREVNIADYFMFHEHFIPDRQKSNKSWLEGHSPNGPTGTLLLTDPKNGDKYLIKRNPMATSEYQFWMVNGDMPGFSRPKFFTLIDYMISKKNLSFADALRAIESYAGIVQPLLPFPTPPAPVLHKETHTANATQLLPLAHPHYLHSRGIHTDTLQDPLLQGRICNRKVKNLYNTVYPMWDRDGQLVTWCEKNQVGNQTYEHFPKNVSTESCLFSSSPPSKTDFILFSEAAIDVISYYQLHPNLWGRSLLLSSNGTLRQTHLPLIQHFIDTLRPNGLIVLNDKDTAGYRYDLMLVGGLHPSGGTANPIHTTITLQKSAQQRSTAKASLTFSAQPDNIADLQQLEQQIRALSRRGVLQYEVAALTTDRTGRVYFTTLCREEFTHIKKLLDLLVPKPPAGQHPFFLIDNPSGADLEGNRIKDWNDALVDNLHREAAGSAVKLSSELLPFLKPFDPHPDQLLHDAPALQAFFTQPTHQLNSDQPEELIFSPPRLASAIQEWYGTHLHQLQVNMFVDTLCAVQGSNPAPDDRSALLQAVYTHLRDGRVTIVPLSDTFHAPGYKKKTEPMTNYNMAAVDQGTPSEAPPSPSWATSGPPLGDYLKEFSQWEQQNPEGLRSSAMPSPPRPS